MVWFLLLACQRSDDPADAIPSDTGTIPFVEPGEPGPYDVGFVTFDFTDPRGKELTVEVWYPAAPQEGEPDPYEPLALTGDAHRDAEPISGRFPLLAFSHGFGGIRYQSIFLTEHLATHGFVIVSPDHPDNTLLDLDPDVTPRVLLERPDDIRFTVDEALRRSAEGEGVLGGKLDADAGYGMMGHSFGAVTTQVLAGGVPDWEGVITYCEDDSVDALACRLITVTELDPSDHGTADPRILASVPMSPGLPYGFGLDGSGLAGVSEVLVLAGDKDDVLPYDTEVLPVWESLGSPKTLATFADAGHYAFSDICRLVAGLFPDCSGPEEGWLDIEQAQATTNTIVTAFWKVKVAGDDRYAPWLEEDELSVFPELTWDPVD